MVGAADRRELNAWDCFVTWGYGGLNVAALMAACPAPIFLHISGQVWLARRTKKGRANGCWTAFMSQEVTVESLRISAAQHFASSKTLATQSRRSLASIG